MPHKPGRPRHYSDRAIGKPGRGFSRRHENPHWPHLMDYAARLLSESDAPHTRRRGRVGWTVDLIRGLVPLMYREFIRTGGFIVRGDDGRIRREPVPEHWPEPPMHISREDIQHLMAERGIIRGAKETALIGAERRRRVGLGKLAMNAGRQNAMGVRPRFSIAESRAFFRILSKTGDFREAAARFEEQTGKKPPVSEATGNDFLARALRRGN